MVRIPHLGRDEVCGDGNTGSRLWRASIYHITLMGSKILPSLPLSAVAWRRVACHDESAEKKRQGLKGWHLRDLGFRPGSLRVQAQYSGSTSGG